MSGARVPGVWYEVCVWRSKWVGAFPLLVALSSSSLSMFPSEASVGLGHNLWSYVSHTDRSQSKRAKHKKKTLQHNVDFNIFYVLCHDSNVNAQYSMGHTFSTHCFGARMLVVYEAFKNLCYFSWLYCWENDIWSVWRELKRGLTEGVMRSLHKIHGIRFKVISI